MAAAPWPRLSRGERGGKDAESFLGASLLTRAVLYLLACIEVGSISLSCPGTPLCPVLDTQASRSHHLRVPPPHQLGRGAAPLLPSPAALPLAP